MTEVLDTFFKAIGDSYNFLNNVHPLAAIWLTKPLVTQQGRTVRIRDGHLVKVEEGKLVDCTDEPTHLILQCFGADSHSFSVKAKNLETGKEETIYLPNL